MATKVVNGAIVGPDGIAKAGVVVVAKLSQACTLAGASEVVPSVVRSTSSDASGNYSLTLQANNDLVPTGSFYTVNEADAAGTFNNVFTVVVPQSAGPFQMASIMTGVPPTASPTPVITLLSNFKIVNAVTDIGLDPTGATDGTGLLNSYLASLMPGIGLAGVWVDFVGRFLFLGQIVAPVDATLPVPFGLPWLRLYGRGSYSNGRWIPGTAAGPSILDLRYGGAGVAKIKSNGVGVLEIDHLTLMSGGSDNVPFVQVTNTTPKFHDNAVIGNQVNTGTACVQDAFVLGGTGVSQYDGTDTASFQGYGGFVRDNYFSNIRRIALGQDACNGIPFENNTCSTTCGNPTGGAIELIGGGPDHACSGNVVVMNTLEVSNYKYAVRLKNAVMNTIGPNGFYDPSGPYAAGVYCDTGASYNDIIDGFRSDSFPLLLEDPAGGQTNQVRTAHQSMWSYFTQWNWFTNGLKANASIGTASFGLLSAGGVEANFIGSDGGFGNPYPSLQVAITPGTTVNDANIYNASRYVTSLTAAFVASDIGLMISRFSATTIPIPTFIVGVYTTSTVPAWQATTVYALGDVIRPTAANAHMYQCTTAGTSGGGQPAFPTNGTSVNDGTAIWLDIGASTAAVMSRNAIATVTPATVTFGRAGTRLNMTQFLRHHIKSTGAAPSGAVDAAAGSPGASISVTGTDLAHTVTVTIGTSPSAGQLAHWNAAINFTATPRMAITPKSAKAAAFLVGGGYFTNGSGAWQMVAVAIPTAGDVLTFDVVTVE